jgi:hypothetical protein
MPKYEPWERPGPVEFLKGWADAQLPDEKATAIALGAMAAGFVVGSRKKEKKKKK